MPPIPLGANFLAGSILTLVLPAGVLIAFAIWYVLTVMRTSGTPVADVVEKIDQIVNPDLSAGGGSGPPAASPTPPQPERPARPASPSPPAPPAEGA